MKIEPLDFAAMADLGIAVSRVPALLAVDARGRWVRRHREARRQAQRIGLERVTLSNQRSG